MTGTQVDLCRFITTELEKAKDALTAKAEGPGSMTGDEMLDILEIEAYISGVSRRVSQVLQANTGDYKVNRDDEFDRKFWEILKDVRNRVRVLGATPLHAALTKHESKTPQKIEPNPAEQEILDTLNALATSSQQYLVEAKHLRSLEGEGLPFTNLLRQGIIDTETGNYLTAGMDPEKAKRISMLLYGLQREFESQTPDQAVTSLLDLLEEIGEHIDSTKSIRPTLRPHDTTAALRAFAENFEWVTANGTILALADGVPSDIQSTVTSLMEALTRLENGATDTSETTPADDDEPSIEDRTLAAQTAIEKLDGVGLLNIRIFPPGTSVQELREDFEENISDTDSTFVNWERLEGLIELGDILRSSGFQVELLRGLPGSLDSTIPYYVLTVNAGERTIAVAENPVYGNATYLIDEQISLADWQELVALDKKTVRELGGMRFVHRDEHDKNGISQHYGRVFDRLVSLV